jgi:glycerol-3-phosphate dehydrogenase
MRLYGSNARRILGPAMSRSDLGRSFGDDLYEAEVRYLAENEWAVTAEDVLWRRTKRGLHIGREAAAALEDFMRSLDSGVRSAAAE